MEAIILAGGFGTRLQSVVQDVPKPMAPINGKPFLAFLLDSLSKQAVRKIILSTGYRHKVIENYFKNCYKGMKIVYSVEQEPLGTGGAILKALGKATNRNVFVINGDTFLQLNMAEMMEKHLSLGSDITMALKLMENFDRYGAVEVEIGKITGFKEKKQCQSGYINGGVYLLRPEIFDVKLPERFSFESDFLEKHVESLNINAFITPGYFIDIGIPEDYQRARTELKNFANN